MLPPDPQSPFKPGLLRRLPQPVRKVVILKASRIGDFICAVPVLRSLRNTLPEALISLITLPMLEELAVRLPYVDRVLLFPGYPGIAEQLFEPHKTANFFDQMLKEEFDLGVQIQGSGVNANPFMLMLGAKYTAGFIRPGDPPGLLDAALPLPEEGHEVWRMLSMASFLGVEGISQKTEFPLLPIDITQADASLAGAARPLIGIHASARDRTRRWKPAHFSEAGRVLIYKYGGTLIALGEQEDRETSQHILEAAGCPARNLAGMTSLPVLGAVISRLNLLITNDTGPAHIAYALGTPTITIFGGGDPLRYGPLQRGPFRVLAFPVDCRPCGYADCPIDDFCLEHITPEDVLDAASQLISFIR